jgi:hypothetical protein
VLWDLLVGAQPARAITAAAVNLRAVTSPGALFGGAGEA